MKICDLVKGWFGTYDNNELELVATDDDPPKYRAGKTWKKGQGWNLGAFSWNIVREDGRHEEYGVLRGRLAPNETDGALECSCREGNTERPIFYMDPKGAHFQVPVHAPNITGGLVITAPTFIGSPDGRYQLHMQGDGNLVIYDTSTASWTPLWNTGTQR